MFYSSLLAYTLAALFYPTVTILSYPITSELIACSGLVAVLLFASISCFRKRRLPELRAEPFAILIFILFCSSLVGSKFTLFSEVNFKYLLFLIGAIALVFTQLFKLELFSLKFLLLVQTLIAVAFLTYTGDRLIFSDDHPSFLYRFQLLKEHFPFIPFYNAEWNAGYSAREFFASGMLNVFFVAAPLIYLFNDPDLLNLYNVLIPYLYIFVVPWSVFAAALLLEHSKRTAVLAALLSLAPSLGYFEWLLKYGTLGFAFSIGMAPLAYALVIKLAFSRDIPKWSVVLGLIIVSFLVISWSLSGLIFIPATVLALVKLAKDRDKDVLKKVLAFACLFVVLNGPWIKIFIEESKVFSFVQGSSMPGAEEVASREELMKTQSKQIERNRTKAIKHLKASSNKIHPLIVLLFVPALAFSIGAWNRTVLIATIAWLVFVSFAGEIYKPQLELKRMLLPAAFLLCIPVAEFVLWLKEKLEGNFQIESLKGINPLKLVSIIGVVSLNGAVLLTPYLAANAYSNRSPEKFVLEPVEFRTLATSINEYGGEGRTLFAGFVLHELGSTGRLTQDGGHIAPLSRLSGKPLYASDFYHARWSTVDPIPASYRNRGVEGIEEFLDLVNVTAVVTAKVEWVRYFSSLPNYIEVFRGPRFKMFSRVTETPSYFLEGSGEVKHLPDGFQVLPGSTEMVLKFRFLPKLKPAPEHKGVTLEQHFVFDEEVGKSKIQPVHFIKLKVPEELVKSKRVINLSYNH